MAGGCGQAGSGGSLVIGINDPLCRQTASACVAASADRDYAGLARQLSEATGLRLSVRYYKAEEPLSEAIRSGQVDAAVAKTWTILRAQVGSPVHLVRVADLRGRADDGLLRGVFITRADSGIASLADLAGKTVAFGSTVGYEKSYQARAALAALGVEPGRTIELEACIDVAAAVYERRVDAGVVSHYVVDDGGLEQVAEKGTFRELGRTEGVPFITVAISENVDADVRAKLTDALLTIPAVRVPVDLRATHFAPPRPWNPAELEKP